MFDWGQFMRYIFPFHNNYRELRNTAIYICNVDNKVHLPCSTSDSQSKQCRSSRVVRTDITQLQSIKTFSSFKTDFLMYKYSLSSM